MKPEMKSAFGAIIAAVESVEGMMPINVRAYAIQSINPIFMTSLSKFEFMFDVSNQLVTYSKFNHQPIARTDGAVAYTAQCMRRLSQTTGEPGSQFRFQGRQCFSF